jgi:(p)ppGpp synthase/HD superfamily hydrolase
MILTERQSKLLQFVIEQHGEQKRKYTNEPYWKHVYEVAEIVSEYEGELLIEIALCHDLIEDTECTYLKLAGILFEFGYNSSNEIYLILEGVRDLTDEYTKEYFPQYNRKQRKELELIRLKTISPNSQTVKYADLIHNTSSIVKYDKNFAKVYLKEKEEILNNMRKGDLKLFVKCYNVLQESIKQLENV